MKRELTEKKEKRHPSVLTTKNRLTVSRISITRIVQIILTVDMTTAGTEINIITIIIIKPMNKSSPKTTSLVRMKLMPDNIMNVRIKIFQRSYPPYAHTNQFPASSSRYYDQQPRSSHSVHWVEDQNQQTEYYDQNNYTDAITDFFPLNF